MNNSSAFSRQYFSKSALALLSLMLLMIATRYFHVGSAWRLPDASWAVFFLGGFYLQRRYFALLAVTAVAIDFTFFALGGSQYCLSAAYGFQAPAFAALWFGGDLLRRCELRGFEFFLRAVAYWWVSASLAYLFTNASFYFLSRRIAEPTLDGYLPHAKIWYAAFVARPMIYLVAAALVQFAIAQAPRLRFASH